MNQMRLAIVGSGENYSETFIRAHVDHLPAENYVISSSSDLQPQHAGRPLLRQDILSKGIRKVSRLVSGKSWDWQITQGYLAAFRKIRPHVVLAEYGTSAVRVMEACELAQVPLIAHFHGFDASIHSVVDSHHEKYQQLFQRAAGVIAVSSQMKSKLISLGANPKKTHLNIYGVDTDRFRRAVPGQNPPVVLYVGRFVEKKAPYLVLLSFERLLKLCPDAKLRMIGDGPLLHICKKIAFSLGLNEHVEFLGAMSHEQVSAEMLNSRVFVQHSIQAENGDSEGTPNTVLEAGASGLPVVATRHAGIPDVVVDGVTGFLVDEGDVNGMATYLEKVLLDPQLSDEMGRQAHEWISQNFNMNKSIERLWGVIKAAMDGRNIEPLEKPCSNTHFDVVAS